MSKEFEKQLQDFYQDYRDENGIGWALCDAINVADLAKDTIKFLEKFKDQKISNLEEKLEEYKGRYLTTESYNTFMSNEIHKVVKENNELKQQLAESEEYSKYNIPKLIEANKSLSKQLTEKDAERELDNAFWKQECDNLQKALAEKDEQLQQAIEMINNPDTLFYQQQELIDNLKVQLAEKDKFLKKQKELFETVDRELYLTKDTLKHHTNIYNSLVENKNQDKISFALEQLEKVKEEFDCCYSGDTYTPYQIADKIDNQIASLKNGVE